MIRFTVTHCGTATSGKLTITPSQGTPIVATFCTCGIPPEDIAARARDSGDRLVEEFGLTEATPAITGVRILTDAFLRSVST